MDAQAKEIKRSIAHLNQLIEVEESTRAEWLAQIETVEKILEADPHNAEAKGLIADIEEGAAAADTALKPLYEKRAALEAQLPQTPEVAAPKFDPEKHPLLKKAAEKTEPEKPVVFNTGDICEAQWRDKAWYKAKIQSILGSASAPKYVVKFLDYDDHMTVDRDNVRPLQNKRKREEAAAPKQQSAPVTSAAVISAPASVNPNAQAAAVEPGVDEVQPRKKKIKNKKALAKTVENWKDWTSKGKGKQLSGKDSMFRTGTSVGSRVGFTGSGSGMTESQKRVRYDSKADAEAERLENGGDRPGSGPGSRNYPYPPRPSRGRF